ncbi:glutathione S-transferase family protein [Cupriavidus sp. USMAA2-4]|uniref:glutathione S-transferase family protein n=1 Tax=Cupriavidus sp. USMAA2-4 TaxID=876364 RepID=UPI0009FD09E0|nr:glutathione S-transferase family protein [Cupriavidus sp. USMAA2-4]
MDASVPSATQIGLPEPRASLADARHAAPDLVLVSHTLCPYVQRAAIVLAEKGVAFERRDINLADKPDWFRNISPLGKTPVLLVGDEAIFESAVICEYLDETALPRLHPTNALQRAQHRSWMEFGSALLNSIGAFYNATDEPVLIARAGEIQARFAQIEAALSDGPYFAGEPFSIVDAVFGPVFRYFDVFDAIGDFGFLEGLPKARNWRRALAMRPSVVEAVRADYPMLLRAFLLGRRSALSRRMAPSLTAGLQV